MQDCGETNQLFGMILWVVWDFTIPISVMLSIFSAKQNCLVLHGRDDWCFVLLEHYCWAKLTVFANNSIL